MLLIRLLSALCAAATTLFVFMFLRELFSEPWTWTVGALAVAFQPMFGFMAGGVHPDNLFFAASAALLFGLARAFGRGPHAGTRGGHRRGARGRRARRSSTSTPCCRARSSRSGCSSGGPASTGARRHAGRPSRSRCWPSRVAGYAALNKIAWDRAAGRRGRDRRQRERQRDAADPIGLREQLTYTWQLYLPRLPFMHDQFGYFPPYGVWFKGTIGKLGWLDTFWPNWVYRVALGIFIPLLLLAGLALWRRRQALVRRWPELLSYAVLAAGSWGRSAFSASAPARHRLTTSRRRATCSRFLAFYGAFVALAALGAGRRFGRPPGAALVMLATIHGLLAQLLVISRFYG